MSGLDRKRKVVKIDPLKIQGKIVCGPRELKYDTLVLALGSVPDTFNIPGNCQLFAINFDSIIDQFAI